MRPFLLVVAAAALVAPVLSGLPATTPAVGQTQIADISGDPNKPRRHFRERFPTRLSAAEAEALYAELGQELAAGYARGGHPVATAYLGWRRANRAPYLSVTHGNSYLSNYVNAAAAAYLRYEDAGKLPVGAIIAKPSFVVGQDGQARPGPLFVMEKMPAGFKYVTGDWRYSMIMPDGVLFGETDGADSERVDYCIGCHLVREAFDHLFFVPKAVRVME